LSELNCLSETFDHTYSIIFYRHLPSSTSRPPQCMCAASTWWSLPRTAPPTTSSAWPLIPWPAAPTPTLADPAAGGPQPRPQERASHIERQGDAPSSRSQPARAAAPPAAREARCTRPRARLRGAQAAPTRTGMILGLLTFPG
jgi:hypothetical protein